MTDWREGYKKALKEFVLANGRAADMEVDRWGQLDSKSYYGWSNYDATNHVRGFDLTRYGGGKADPCPAVADPDATVTEERVHQFQDTEFTGDDTEYLLVLHPVSCSCGKLKDAYWAYSGSMGDVVLGLTRD